MIRSHRHESNGHHFCRQTATAYRARAHTYDMHLIIKFPRRCLPPTTNQTGLAHHQPANAKLLFIITSVAYFPLAIRSTRCRSSAAHLCFISHLAFHSHSLRTDLPTFFVFIFFVLLRTHFGWNSIKFTNPPGRQVGIGFAWCQMNNPWFSRTLLLVYSAAPRSKIWVLYHRRVH